MTSIITSLETENSIDSKKIPKTVESTSSKVVFPNGMSDATRSLDKATSPVRTELATLQGLQVMNPTEERTRKIVDLERQRGRIARFSLLQTRATSEQKEILKEKDTLEKLKASDILLLKKKGVDLANLLLVPVGTDPTKSTTREFIERGEHKNFIVNFGENKNINHIIGAGDVLPPTVSRVKINGVEGERKYTPRPGYYELKTGGYLPIYDGDTIEVVKIGAVDEKGLQEANEAQDKWLHERRIEDMIDNDGKALSGLPEDRKLEEEAQEEIKKQKERQKKWEKYNPESKKNFLETFGEVLDRETSKYGIPKDMLVNNLFEKENRSFDPFIKNPESSAYGLGQITDGTWVDISNRLRFTLGRRLDRNNPEDQIIATCEYLNYVKNFRNCSWGESIVYYHAGEHFGDKNVRAAMAVNAPIVARMENPKSPTAEDYVMAAAKYYGVTEYMSV
ncbi:MAG: transglycosylase SLT domain-containing protein [Candidatus Gracilibacteria bacterium]|nr:transglycosylase SLT domain-containing protein [Candidatus Gracilibacteria bacterium]